MSEGLESRLAQLPRIGGPERRILRSRELHSRPDLLVNIRTPENLLHWHEMSLSAQSRPTQWVNEVTVTPFIRCGQYMFHCPSCLGGVAADPDPTWPSCCFACGAIYTSFNWLADMGEVERLLLLRPDVMTRTWHAGEQSYPTDTIDDIKLENVTHGVSIVS